MATAVKQTHPVRGALWGLMLGVGLALVLVVTTVIYLELVPILIVIAIAIVVGILWGIFAPAKPPKGPEPIPVEHAAAPESSRFDDFTPGTDSDPSAKAPPPVTIDDAPGDEPDASGDSSG